MYFRDECPFCRRSDSRGLRSESDALDEHRHSHLNRGALPLSPRGGATLGARPNPRGTQRDRPYLGDTAAADMQRITRSLQRFCSGSARPQPRLVAKLPEKARNLRVLAVGATTLNPVEPETLPLRKTPANERRSAGPTGRPEETRYRGERLELALQSQKLGSCSGFAAVSRG